MTRLKSFPIINICAVWRKWGNKPFDRNNDRRSRCICLSWSIQILKQPKMFKYTWNLYLFEIRCSNYWQPCNCKTSFQQSVTEQPTISEQSTSSGQSLRPNYKCANMLNEDHSNKQRQHFFFFSTSVTDDLTPLLIWANRLIKGQIPCNFSRLAVRHLIKSPTDREVSLAKAAGMWQQRNN